ncbi:MAG TPA: DUF4147 domain-containing protein [Polyangia bacterium]|nr:DUF4147 domain-containing protein [Polyangia bacterium]
MQRSVLEQVFREAVAACEGGALMHAAAGAPDALPATPLYLLGAGKAAVAMARGLLERVGPQVAGGQLTTKRGHGAALPGLEVIEAAHPVPDESSLAAGREALARAGALSIHDTLVVLLSGGASALWCVPAPGLSLADKRAATMALLRAGVDIGRLNAVRKHLSALKGGRLAEAAGAGTISVFLLSDVLGDAVDVVGSGPCVPDHSTLAEALAVARSVPGLPDAVLRFLEQGADETPKRMRDGVTVRVIGNHDTLRAAATRAALGRGLRALAVPPDADDVAACATRWAGLAPAPPGALYVGGGEPTVRAPLGRLGRGGRAQHLALLVARALRGRGGVFLAAGSDGTDGSTEAAGAIVDGATWAEAERRGLDPEAALESFDSHRVHAALGTLVSTGPTGTNLLDLHLYAA